MPVPDSRIDVLRDQPPRPDGSFVLYGMTAARRTRSNPALQRAAEWARELGQPLIVLEALRAGYEWASDRHHRFVIQGMVDNARALAGTGVLYHPYVEPRPGDGRGLLAALAETASVVIADAWPGFFHPRMLTAAADRVTTRLEAVDSCGLLPIATTPGEFLRAYDFRRFLQRELAPHLGWMPDVDPLAPPLPSRRRLPPGIAERWPRADLERLLRPDGLAELPIDHSVAAVDETGGARAARRALETFLDERLEHYGEKRSRPDTQASSGLSAWLHHGHISTHEVLAGIAERTGWTPDAIDLERRNGARNGWWGLDASGEAFLDELVTWRELGLAFHRHRPDAEDYASLPDWARQTLSDHALDPRPHVYRLEQFDAAETHDPLWNAAQNELRRSGRIHNYLRMLWAKKVLHWSRAPEEAAAILVELNNRYAIDGRDPNSYSGIYWTFGRFDRAWGPERPVFGKVRYMASDNTRRKFRVDDYIARWTGTQASLAF